MELIWSDQLYILEPIKIHISYCFIRLHNVYIYTLHLAIVEETLILRQTGCLQNELVIDVFYFLAFVPASFAT